MSLIQLVASDIKQAKERFEQFHQRFTHMSHSKAFANGLRYAETFSLSNTNACRMSNITICETLIWIFEVIFMAKSVRKAQKR